MAKSAQRIQLERKAAAVIEIKRRRSADRTVFGIVSPDKGLLYSITSDDKGKWSRTDKNPSMFVAEITERILKSTKRFIILIGGRGSGKSVFAIDDGIADIKDNNSKVYCLREYQSSIKNSVYSLALAEIKRHRFEGFEPVQSCIGFKGEQALEFAGLARNVDSVKSAHGFKKYIIEESQFITEVSLDTLTATARKEPKNGVPVKFQPKQEIKPETTTEAVSLIFLANPSSTEDPFSKRFINPYISELDKNGIYEDDLHLIVKINYVDNPWFEDSGLDGERLWDKAHRSDAFYTHKWLAGFNDGVDDALIMGEWFEACIDAHLKLGFKPLGAKIVAHDPSDTGDDDKGYGMRHGSVVLDVCSKADGDVNEGGHWAANRAIDQQADYFTWDCDGMGVGLNEQMSRDFDGKKVKLVMFKGSESPDNPGAIYNQATNHQTENQKRIEEVFRNKRNQYYWELKDRIYRTYRAVMFSEYQDPEKMISFSSEIEELSKLKAELCRMPTKNTGNGFLQLHTKQEMKNKFMIKSQNLGDCVMMLMRYKPMKQRPVIRPPVLRPIK